ncbi:MAG: putative thiol oxidoreductase [Verrucomicrobiaceae bacterium]|nr:putative thiol oxidoreductase [Verrucomicrobiaceae bacterium]
MNCWHNRALIILIATFSCAFTTAKIKQPAPVAGREAFGQPLPNLTDTEREQFFRGRALFHQSWVIAPANDTAVGLGPLYNRISCISCHPKNGRGRAPENSQQRMQSMLVRLSVPGENSHGGPKPHPNYGDQLNEQGIPGVPGEGIATIVWQEFETQLNDGTVISMRRPLLSFHDLNYGALDDVLSSARVGPPVFGLGLLQAIDERYLLRLAKQKKADGVNGKINWVWSAQTQKSAIGRFGAKANTATLREQIVAAMIGDLGITSTLHPQENCTPIQAACLAAPSGGHPELTDVQLAALEFYFTHLAPPEQRDKSDPQVQRGEKLFRDSGCALCHQPSLRTGKNERFPHLVKQEIHPYTDLLLHDMGDGLADNRPDFFASGREWRTPPLWGIGLTEFISEYQSYLHDGRARTLTEAILWHDGEAKIARQRFVALSSAERSAIEQFLHSL